MVQLSDGSGDEHLVRFNPGSRYEAPNLKAVLGDQARVKLYHFARFDLAALYHYLGVTAGPVFCTKIASRLTRTLYRTGMGSRTWSRNCWAKAFRSNNSPATGAGRCFPMPSATMPPATCVISTACVTKLTVRLEREGRTALAQACFDFPSRPRPARPCGLGRDRYLRPRIKGRRAMVSSHTRIETSEARALRSRRQHFAAPGGSHDRLVGFSGAVSADGRGGRSPR